MTYILHLRFTRTAAPSWTLVITWPSKVYVGLNTSNWPGKLFHKSYSFHDFPSSHKQSGNSALQFQIEKKCTLIYLTLEVLALVGGLVAIFYFPIDWVANHPNWRTHIFQRGGPTTNQSSLEGLCFKSADFWSFSRSEDVHHLLGSNIYSWWIFMSANGYIYICIISIYRMGKTRYG